ncbi:MAG: methanol--corrinoid methyltransferase [Planctomycetes bacterium]|nr:methanol--corrinoid methyltransferase [Planctomycetota bacterium]
MTAATGKAQPRLAISSMKDFAYGRAPRPVTCGTGVKIGAGEVVPELNFTLPPIDINESTWPEIRRQYTQMIGEACRRAVELEVPALLVEFETLPPMTVRPAWGAEITRILADALRDHHAKHGIETALRLTPNDTRDHVRPPLMRRGQYFDGMIELFDRAADAGADLLAIESTGGKEVCDEALMNADIRTVVFALGVLGSRDMAFLWQHIVEACRRGRIVPSGDTACGFANTAMVLAEQKMIPRVFAAVVRIASVPRSLVAYEMGAVGPSKDCAYEGPYMKAIAGVPISMEGRTAACAHLSPVGNIAQAVCDCWSNESVQNVRLLSANAPTVSLEQLAYDARLLNQAAASPDGARQMRDWLVASDAPRDPQAWVLRPDVVLDLAGRIMQEPTSYLRTRRAVLATVAELKRAHDAGQVKILPREVRWLDLLREQAETLPDNEDTFINEMRETPEAAKFLPAEYGL